MVDGVKSGTEVEEQEYGEKTGVRGQEDVFGDFKKGSFRVIIKVYKMKRNGARTVP